LKINANNSFGPTPHELGGGEERPPPQTPLGEGWEKKVSANFQAHIWGGGNAPHLEERSPWGKHNANAQKLQEFFEKGKKGIRATLIFQKTVGGKQEGYCWHSQTSPPKEPYSGGGV